MTRNSLATNIKLALHKALIKSITIYACPAWQYAADSHLLKLQSLKNKVLCTNGNFLRRTPVRDLHMACKLPYIHKKLYRQQVIQNHENANVRNTGQGEHRQWKCKRLKLGGA
jgi:hypothetical protein